ncbi:MAG TPA: ATP-binding cassette domain-containing protein, partial [Saprospiraceae bacterium]|nr:ATP-binding cassette domain-containing protein [Saprospiraceae bacterium]
MINIQNLTKRFGRLCALDDINAQFSAGQSIALIGPNGSGKTTLLKCLLGMARPDSGALHFEGYDLAHSDAYRARIGYMPQIGRYPDNMRIGQLFDMMR